MKLNIKTKPRIKLCIGRCNPKVVGMKEEDGKQKPIVHCDSCNRFLGR